MHSRVRSAMFALSFAVSASALFAQSAQPTLGAVDRVFRIGGVVPTVAGPAETIALAIYDSETGGTALWTEVQTVAVDSQGRYSVLLGSTDPAGLPLDLFATGEPRWLSTQVQRAGQAAQPRSLLTSVPYALRAAKASDADTLGGRPASSYLLAPSAGGDPAADSAAAASDPTFRSPSPLTSGSIGRIGKFVTGVDLGDSVMTESSGRIGVGTTAPLDVVHSAFTDGSGVLTGYAVQNLSSAAGAYSGMLFYDHLGNLGQFQGFNNSTKEYRINNIGTGGTINFMIGSSSKFLVANNGNVGIGVPSPTYKMDVSYGGGSAGLRLKSTSNFSALDMFATGGEAFLRFGDATNLLWYNSASATQWRIGEFNSGDRMNVDTLGNVTIGTGATGCLRDRNATVIAGTCSSDLRFKTNVSPFAPMLDKLSRLQPVSYFWRASDYADRHFGTDQSWGLIAQDVEQVLPELVVTDEQGYLAVNYSKLPLITIQAVKELKAENDILKAQNAVLGSRLTALEQALQQLTAYFERQVQAPKQ